MSTIGKTTWAIAEGYIPAWSHGPGPEMISHEDACILNANDEPAEVRIFIYYADREPVGPYLVTVDARRTLHIRFNDLEQPEPIPRGVSYASVFHSTVPGCSPAHASGFTPGGKCFAFDNRFSRRLTAANHTFPQAWAPPRYARVIHWSAP